MKFTCFLCCIAFVLFSAGALVLSPSFTLNEHAFAAAQPAAPSVHEQTVHLRWKDMGAGITYHFQMARDKDFRQILIDKMSDKPEITFPEPAASGAYFIRLRPIGPDGRAGSFFPPQRYEISSTPEPPIMLSPEEIAEYRDIYDIKAAWSSVPRGESYRVVLARDRKFRYVIYDNPNVKNTSLTFWNLDYGTYFLKVSAIGKNGAEGPFSDTVRFIVVPPVPFVPNTE